MLYLALTPDKPLSTGEVKARMINYPPHITTEIS